ncbi:MAG TPA: RNA polymerase sigma factor [Candidatus Polarisedimenticolaceae bacterium]|nr:RNA polymerase sigma factor [Candidatus Polarisedimenticolaceae bacterium]
MPVPLLTTLFHEERPRALATLVRLVGDLDLAEDVLQEAFAVALTQWPREGVPGNPASWLISTARHKAIDRLRRARNLAEKQAEIAALSELASQPMFEDVPLPDDRLRLIFTCCHPALALEAQVALTLKTLCGLTVEEIARAFLVPQPTMAQRLVRAKAKIKAAGIPYEVPERAQLGERLDGVLRVVYLVFTEGYAPTAGEAPTRPELCAEAIRLARLMHALLPRESEVTGLLALVLLQDSRRAARFDAAGALITLEEQDRRLWDQEEIAEGLPLVEAALREGNAGFYALQAAIAGCHARAEGPGQVDWAEIAGIYAVLLARHPSPVVALNHAAATGMAFGPERGLALLEALERTGQLTGYHLLAAARADLLRRLGRTAEAADAYRDALGTVTSPVERRYLTRRLEEALR